MSATWLRLGFLEVVGMGSVVCLFVFSFRFVFFLAFERRILNEVITQCATKDRYVAGSRGRKPKGGLYITRGSSTFVSNGVCVSPVFVGADAGHEKKSNIGRRRSKL